MLRPARPDDAPALHQLINEIEQGDGLPMVTPLAEVEDWFDSPDIAPELDTRVWDEDGRLVGYGVVDHSPSGERLERAILFGRTHPERRRRGVGRVLLEWQIERAEERLAATDPALPAYLIAWGFDFEHDTLDFLERRGFDRARFDHELLRPLDGLPELVEIPGVRIEPWSAARSESARLAFNASFADHWGSTPRSPERWQHILASAGSRPDLSFVAVDETTNDVVAFSWNGHYPEDQEVTGRLDGWIESLGTVRSHRKRGLASALIVRSLHAFAGAGLDHAALGVDTENPSGAYGLYAGIGFEPMHTLVTMRRTVRAEQ